MPSPKDEERDQLQRQTERYLARGHTITQVPFGMTAMDGDGKKLPRAELTRRLKRQEATRRGIATT